MDSNANPYNYWESHNILPNLMAFPEFFNLFEITVCG